MPRKTPLHKQEWTHRAGRDGHYAPIEARYPKADDWCLADDITTQRALACLLQCSRRTHGVETYLAHRTEGEKDDAPAVVAVRRLSPGTTSLRDLPRGCWPEAWKQMLADVAQNVMWVLVQNKWWKDSFADAENVSYDPVVRRMMIRNWSDVRVCEWPAEGDRALPHKQQFAALMLDAQRVYDEIHGTKAAASQASEGGTESSDDEDSGRVSDEADETLVVDAESEVLRTPSPLKRRRLEL